MNKESILADFEQLDKKLMAILSHFTPDNFNKRPSENEWSAAEVAEHLLKVETFANQSLRSEAERSNHAPDEKIDFLKARMEDENKRVASERVAPSGEPKDLSSLINQLKEQGNQMKEAIQLYDETEACTGMPHPVVGVMTRMEWFYFIIYHTERHLRQLKRLQERIAV